MNYPAMDDYQNRDTYDSNLEAYLSDLNTEKINATNFDSNWASNKVKIIDLNKQIQDRKNNYNTYKGQIEMQKELYNREWNKTIILGVANAVALLGCAYVWVKP